MSTHTYAFVDELYTKLFILLNTFKHIIYTNIYLSTICKPKKCTMIIGRVKNVW